MKYSALPLMLILLFAPITLADDAKEVVTKIYPVADLVVDGPTENSQLRRLFQIALATEVDEVKQLKGHLPPTVAENLNELSDVIRSTSSGDSEISVASYIRTRSLIVRAPQETHDNIVQLLEGLRRSGETSIQLTLEFFSSLDESSGGSGIQQTSAVEQGSDSEIRAPTIETWLAARSHQLAPKEVAEFRKMLAEQNSVVEWQQTRTSRSGYSLDAADAGLIVTATASADRRIANLNLTRVGENGLMSQSYVVRSGHSAVHTFGAPGEEQFPCLITATVVVPEEEEELVVPAGDGALAE